jgi:excisionase family DNA binding protein
MSEPMNRTRRAPLDELLTVNEVADELRVDRRTIYHYLRQGQLRGQKLRRTWRISRSDLTTYLNERHCNVT